MVLYRRRSAARPYPDWPPGVQQCSFEETPKLAPTEPQEEDNGEVLYLMNRIKALAQSGLIVIKVMSICIMQGLQPLQYPGHPLWCFNWEDDATCCGCKGPDSAAALAKFLSELFKREEEEFIRIKPQDGFSMYNPPSWVSYISFLPVFPHYLS